MATGKILLEAAVRALNPQARMRYLGWIKRQIKKIQDESSTPARVKRLEKYQKALEVATKKRGEGLAASQKRPPKMSAAAQAAAKARVQKLKEEFAKYKGKPTSPAQRAKIEQRRRARKLRIDNKLAIGNVPGSRRTLRLTPEGEDLYRGNEADLKRLENSFNRQGESRYAYETVTGRARSSIGGRAPGEPPSPERGERIRERLEGSTPPLTRQQLSKEMGLSNKGTLPTEAELKAAGGFEIYKKGGYKKYQSRSKLGKREHVYVGGGLVGDIPHFRPKKKVKKK
jgi:hypothetical protein